jgi:hypothetical protein
MLEAPAFRLCSWVLALAVAAAAAGCGSSSGDNPKLSRTAASGLRSDLDQIQQSVRSGDCATAEQRTADMQARIDALPGRVSASLRNALAGSADRLDVLVRDHCAAAAAPTTTEPTTTTPQDTTQENGSEQDKKDKSSKDKKPKKDKQNPQEVPPGGNGGDGTSPGQQDEQPSNGDGSGGAGL